MSDRLFRVKVNLPHIIRDSLLSGNYVQWNRNNYKWTLGDYVVDQGININFTSNEVTYIVKNLLNGLHEFIEIEGV